MTGVTNKFYDICTVIIFVNAVRESVYNTVGFVLSLHMMGDR